MKITFIKEGTVNGATFAAGADHDVETALARRLISFGFAKPAAERQPELPESAASGDADRKSGKGRAKKRTADADLSDVVTPEDEQE